MLAETNESHAGRQGEKNVPLTKKAVAESEDSTRTNLHAAEKPKIRKPGLRVHWPSPTVVVPAAPVSTPTGHIPSAYDQSIHRAQADAKYKGSVPVVGETKRSTTGAESGERPRGRSPIRRASSAPARERFLSPLSLHRRPAPAALDLSSVSAQPSKSLGNVMTSSSSTPAAKHSQVVEARLSKSSSAAASDLSGYSNSGSFSSSLSSTPSSGSSGSPTEHFSGPTESRSKLTEPVPDDDSQSDEESIVLNTAPFDKRPQYTRAPVSQDKFRDHRDTFALLHLPKKE